MKTVRTIFAMAVLVAVAAAAQAASVTLGWDAGLSADCAAQWNLESGALSVDSKGGNTLTNAGVAADTSNFKQGAASGAFVRAEGDYLSIADAALDAGFPLKAGDTGKTISVCGWFRPAGLGVLQYLFSKYDSAQNKRSIAFAVLSGNVFRLYQGHSNGDEFASADLSGLPLEIGQWYHWAFTYDDATRAYRIRCRRDGQAAVELPGTFTNPINIEDTPLAIGADGAGKSNANGLIDRVSVYKVALTPEQIDRDYAGMVQPPQGFRLFMRESSDAYDYKAPVLSGSTTTATVQIPDDVTRFFVSRAYAGDTESADSNEVSYTSPAVPPVRLIGSTGLPADLLSPGPGTYWLEWYLSGQWERATWRVVIPQPVPPAAQILYHGNTTSHLFHKPDCRYYGCQTCTAVFSSMAAAQSTGYQPCRICLVDGM